MHQHNLLVRDEKLKRDIIEFQPVAPYEGTEANSIPDFLLGRINLKESLQEGETNVWLRNGPYIFLRLMPTQNLFPIEPLDVKDLMVQTSLEDLMGYRTRGAFYWVRNGEGAAAFTIDLDTQEFDRVLAFWFTHVFSNREIWGVDTWLLDPERTKIHSDKDWAHIASFTLEEGMMTALSQYLRFARDQLQLSLPLRWVAGIYDIREHRLAVDEGYSELPYKNERFESGLINNFATPIHKILEPFFESVWKEFGVRRPPEATKRWEKASGFDLGHRLIKSQPYSQ